MLAGFYSGTRLGIVIELFCVKVVSALQVHIHIWSSSAFILTHFINPSPVNKIYHKCSKILNNFLFLFINNLLDFRSGIHKILVRIANREPLVRLLLQPDMGLPCLSRPRVFEILEHYCTATYVYHTAQYATVNVLNFSALVACQISQTHIRSSLIRVFPVCYSYKHFVNSSPDNQHLLEDRK